MLPIITARNGDQITLEVKFDISGSMLEREEKILLALNAAGNVVTREALNGFDADGQAIVMGGVKWHSKGKQSKVYNTGCRQLLMY